MYENISTNSKKMQVVEVKSKPLHPQEYVRASFQGKRHVGVVLMERPTPGGCTQKISAEEYIDLRTGEIKRFDRNTSKQRENLQETFKNLTALIRTNFDAENENKQLFITLTYAENMRDANKLKEDWKAFYKRLKRFMPEHHFEYISVAEPQGRGAWHLHVMLKSDLPLFVDNRDTSRLWGHGMTDTQRLKSDDVGRYYVAYFTDLFGEFGEKAKKKGGRLPFYPVGMKFYRCSRGIQRPDVRDVRYTEILEEYGVPEYRNTYEILNEAGEVVQRVRQEHFKKR